MGEWSALQIEYQMDEQLGLLFRVSVIGTRLWGQGQTLEDAVQDMERGRLPNDQG